MNFIFDAYSLENQKEIFKRVSDLSLLLISIEPARIAQSPFLPRQIRPLFLPAFYCF